MAWQPEAGCHALTLVCKATYRLLPGRSPLADRPEPPYLADVYFRGDSRRSLCAATDLVPCRPHADVVLVGRACAPGGVPLRSIVTRLAVGAIDKRIEVFAHRSYETTGALRWGAPLVRMSLWYERAAGGRGTDNPVGIRCVRRPGHGQVYLPNLQPPGLGHARPGAAIPTVSYGPIAASWPGRVRLLAALPKDWDAEAWWQRPLPRGLDLAFFNAAPTDQRLTHLDDDERIVLENLLADQPTLDTRLAGVRPAAVVKRPGAAREPLALTADTLWIDSVREVATLCWRATVSLATPEEAGTIEVTLGTHRRSGRPAPPRRATAAAPPADSASFAADDTAPTLARPSTPGWAALMSPEEISYEAVPGVEDESEWDTQKLLDAADTADTLPDGRAAEAAASETITLTGPLPDAIDPLPFRSPPADAGVAAGSSPPAPTRPDWVRPSPLEARRGVEALKRRRFEASPWDGGPSARAVVAPRVGAWAPPAEEAAGGRRSSHPPPPPLLGPLATFDMVRRADAGGSAAAAGGANDRASSEAAVAAAIARAVEEEDVAAEPPAADAVVAEPPEAPALRPIEICAAIAASLGRRPAERAAILEEQELSAEGWQAIESHWAEAISMETAQGRSELLRAYDAAYVEQLENERGPLQPEEYARLVIAAERGDAGPVLAALELPRNSLLRLERVMAARVADRAPLAQQVRRAIQAARRG